MTPVPASQRPVRDDGAAKPTFRTFIGRFQVT